VRAVAVVMLGAAASGEPVVSSERQRHDSLTSTQLIDDAASAAADRLAATEKLIRELNETWEEKIRKSDEIRRQRYCRPLHCNALQCCCPVLSYLPSESVCVPLFHRHCSHDCRRIWTNYAARSPRDL